MSDPVVKLHILARTEMALADMRLQRTVKRSAYFAVAMVFALIGLGMINVAAFYAFSVKQGPAVAALIVAVIDVVATAALLLAIRRVVPEENEAKLREIRDLAQAELNKDIEQGKAEIAQITADLHSISSGVLAFSGAAANTVAPLLKMLTRAIKK
jgi:hypothetical protein